MNIVLAVAILSVTQIPQQFAISPIRLLSCSEVYLTSERLVNSMVRKKRAKRSKNMAVIFLTVQEGCSIGKLISGTYKEGSLSI